MPRQIVLNGKFLSASPTGVHRVAAELGNALADLIREDHLDAQGLELRVLAPANGMSRAGSMHMATDRLAPLAGIPWEQMTLPLRKRRALLLNLCNIGPMLAREAVTMIHDVQVLLSPQSYPAGFRAWYRLVQPIIARRHRHILTVSEYSRGQIVSAGLCGPDKVSVIHNGVDHVLRVAADSSVFRRLGLGRHSFVLGLANTQAHKNITVLMQAFAMPALAHLQLVLFGSASRKDFIRAGVTVPENVIFAGRIDDGALRGLFEQALCLAFPSTTEGFGLPPLEAMLLECPAIVVPCGALPEVCGTAALYASPDDPRTWAELIAKLSGSPALRRSMTDAGAVHAARFTWRAAAITLAGTLARI